MNLVYKKGKGLFSEYISELTDELDKLAGFNNDECRLYHYILVDNCGDRCFPIRIHGGTVGGIWYDEKNIITKISIDVGYVVKSYPSNVNEIIEKYVGKEIRIP